MKGSGRKWANGRSVVPGRAGQKIEEKEVR
jgi:hypothetical protein